MRGTLQAAAQRKPQSRQVRAAPEDGIFAASPSQTVQHAEETISWPTIPDEKPEGASPGGRRGAPTGVVSPVATAARDRTLKLPLNRRAQARGSACARRAEHPCGKLAAPCPPVVLGNPFGVNLRELVVAGTLLVPPLRRLLGWTGLRCRQAPCAPEKKRRRRGELEA